MSNLILQDREEKVRIVSGTGSILSPLALSIIIPIYNEAKNIPLIYHRIVEVMADAGKSYQNSYEILFIDDGSTDDSFEICLKITDDDPRVRAVQFRRNFGKTAALQAGFSLSRGAYVVTIDGDMQEDPADMFKFLDLIDQGYDMVSGWRKNRNDPLAKTVPSKIFNWFVSRITRISLHDFNCGFKAYRREVIKEIKLYGDLHRFIPVLVYQRGFRITELAINHQRRKFGNSKFGAKRLYKGYLDFIQVLFLANFLQFPLRLFGAIGTILGFLGALILLYLTILWFDGIRPIGDRPLMTLGVLLILMGVQLYSTGLIGEILRKDHFIADEEYAIRKTAGFHNGKSDELSKR
jgi:glycosyltransferase involved in cell wall biosynthesis